MRLGAWVEAYVAIITNSNIISCLHEINWHNSDIEGPTNQLKNQSLVMSVGGGHNHSCFI